MLMILCSKNTAYEPESSLTMSPQSTTMPLYFWYWSSSCEFLRWQIHQWRKMNLSVLSSCFIDHFFLVSWFRQLPCGIFLLFFQLFFHCCLCIWNFHCLRHRNEFVHKTKMWENSSLLQWCDLDEVCVQLLPALVSCVRRHHQHKRSLSCDSQYCGGSLHCSLSVFLQGIAAGIGYSNFLAYDLRAPCRLLWHGLTGTPGRSPFRPIVEPSTGPSASRKAAALTCPYAGLTVHWAVLRLAGDPVDSDPGASSRTIPSLDRARVRALSVATLGSRRSCPGWAAAHLTWMMTVFTSLAYYLGAFPGKVGPVVSAPRGDHLPLRAAWLFLLCDSLEVFATPTRRYHGRTLIRPSLPACATRSQQVLAHTQFRDPRESAAAR